MATIAEYAEERPKKAKTWLKMAIYGYLWMSNIYKNNPRINI